ncbi:MAG: hypothetical protein WD042_17920 [Phycisphaeraceae bacterium]
MLTSSSSTLLHVTAAGGSPASYDQTLALTGGDATPLIPGGELTLRCDDWSAGRYLVADVDPHSDVCVQLVVDFFAKGQEKPRFHVTMGLFPNLACRWVLDLAYLDGQSVFFARTPGRLKATAFGERLERDEIERATLSLVDVKLPQRLLVGRVTLSVSPPEYVLPDKVVVDELGQWAEKDWPGKTAGEAELVRRLRDEVEQVDGGWPDSWSRYGGSLRHRFEGTGYFRVHHDGRRWWLVDPEGCGFWSVGLDCVGATVATALVAGTEKLFAALPDDDNGSAAPRRQGTWGTPTADFAAANLQRAFGPSWRQQWERITTCRLHDWRFNTIANWSDLTYARRSGMPYVMPMPAYPSTTVKLFRDLPDVFDPAFAQAAERWAQHLADFRDDPMLIGYFMSNEPIWGFGKFNLAAEMLEADAGTHTRRELACFIEKRYSGDVRAWTKAWGIAAAGFEALVSQRFHRIAHTSSAAYDDCWAFSAMIVQRFVRIPAEACRQVDPRHLNLGLRYAWIASDLFYEGAPFVDVFSINCYQMAPETANLDEIARCSGRPVMIGEFHFGALDRGLPGNGLKGVRDQHERGKAYRRFVETAAAHPAVVGAHYFTLNDQPVLGRFDGENWQIGCVDICNRPYTEFKEGATATHERLYEVAAGEVAPYAEAAIEAPRIAH